MNRQLDEILSCLSGRDLFVSALYGEARGEPVEGQLAVAQIIQNRVKDGRWGDTLHKVLGAWAQFSCMWPTLGGSNYRSVIEFADGLGEDDPTQGTRLRDQLYWVVDGVMDGFAPDNVYGSTHYFATWMPSPPYWAKAPAVRMTTIGRHEFWHGVA